MLNAVLVVFLVGYLFVIFEHFTKLHRVGIILLTASLCWGLYLSQTHDISYLLSKLSGVAQVIFFLIGAMTIVQLVEAHLGFHILTNCLTISSKRLFLWCFSLTTFFLSAILDNVATVLVMLAFLRTLELSKQEKMLLGSAAIIAANSGGAWTPIGDVTTSLLWIEGKISSFSVIKELFFPSLISLLVPLALFSRKLKGTFSLEIFKASQKKIEPGAIWILGLGMGGLLLLPVLHTFFHIPPCIGILFPLGILWLITDVLHGKHRGRAHLKVPHVLTRIDTGALLFFVGILLAVDALSASGFLLKLASSLESLHSEKIVAISVGLFSALIDNIPLVVALIEMYPTQYPIDSPFWNMIAYAVGTGGSIFVIGSAAGLIWMGMEKIHFTTYLKIASFPAFLGFVAGLIFYLI